MDMITISAKTLDEAITKALLELRTTSEHLYYEVVQKESTGFLGLFGGKPCVIRARVMGEEEEKEAKKKKAEKEKAEKAARVAAEKAAKIEVEKEKAKAEAQKVIKVKEEAQKAEKEKIEAEKKKNDFAEKINHSVEEMERNTEAQTTDEKSGEKSRKKYGDQKDYEKRRYGKKEGYRSDNRDKRNSEVRVEKQEKEPKVKADVKMDEALVQRKAKEFLEQVFGAMGMKVSVETSVDAGEGELQVMMNGDDMGILIGKRGQTLDSLQYLVSLVVNKETEGYLRVKLDTENYRERRKETLETLARNISYKVKRTKKPVSLEPMNPYERRIIHSALQNDRYVVTRSEGEDPYRHVVISLKRDSYNKRDRYSRRENKEFRDRDKQVEKPVVEKVEEGFE
ncbi:MAG: KH domain-containing protein [Lachnospiraceae bacterium]|jgi:spoIIIJ-associated protein|nr:KH domain-containing protein [Lachnospiraceae bacterium]